MAQPAPSSPAPRRPLEIVSVEPEPAEPLPAPTASPSIPQPQPAAPSALPTATPDPARLQATLARQAAVFGALQAMALIISVRLLLLLVLVGALTLAVMAMPSPTLLHLAVLAAYCILVVIPMVWLERTNRMRS